MSEVERKRILIVDDSENIHKDFYKILADGHGEVPPDEEEILLFGKTTDEGTHTALSYALDSAYQGQEAIDCVHRAIKAGKPYALAFVDVRMPPGMDGIETIRRLWEIDFNIQIVICSAYADYTWEDVTQRLGHSDNFLILKKPFEGVEIRQLACALTRKWELRQQVQFQIENLENLVEARTTDLEKNLSLTEATLESTAEGIVVVGTNREIVRYNQKFLPLFGLSGELIQSEKAYTIFERLSEQVENSTAFLQEMQRLDVQPDAKGTREWLFKNKKVVECYQHPQYLGSQIIGTVYSFRDITEQKRLEEQLLYQATHDDLTDLPNRVLLTDRIYQAILHAKRYRQSVGVLLFDLDNFKQVNDSLGHGAGDRVLKQFAERLRARFRESDTTARFGGDEFIVVLPSQTHEENIVSMANKLAELSTVPYQVEDHSFIVTTSIGVSLYPKDGQDPDTLIKNADSALYQAKKRGPGAVQFYLARFNKDLLQQSELKMALYSALEKQEFVLHYQPLLELRSGRIIGLEALLRWQHPTLGLLYPESFLSLVEETKLIVPIGEWVLKTACVTTKAWQQVGFPWLHISVNVSATQLQQPNFVEIVRKILQETGFDPKFLELELTENMLSGNAPELAKKMAALKHSGVHFAIDDFGTGYSNLGYLKFLPFDKVKIDKMFIDEIMTTADDKCMVETIIQMSQKMGLEVLAEGVEKGEQVKYLRSHHGDQVQGFYYSRALDGDACTQFLQKHAQSHKR